MNQKLYTSKSPATARWASTFVLTCLLLVCSLFANSSYGQVLTPFSGSNSIACGTNSTLCTHAGCGVAYASNASGFTVLNAAGSSVINVNGSYNTESNFDYVTIYSGSGTGGAQVFGPASGSGTINFTGTPGQTYTVGFTSDGSVEFTGYNLAITYTGSCATSVLTPFTGSNSIACGANTTLCTHAGCGVAYASNANGFTVINAANSAVVNINGTYNTESSFDYVTIYSGSGTGGAQVFGPASGSGTINFTGTPGQTYTVGFTSDGSVEFTGYNLAVTYTGSCLPPTINVPATGSNSVACGVTTDIFDNGGTGNYSDNDNGFTVLNNSGASVITLTGTYSGIETCCDALRIYSGAGIGGTLLATYTGTGTIATIVSSPGQTLTVQFTSDASVVGAGFALNAAYAGTCGLPCNLAVTANANQSIFCGSGSPILTATPTGNNGAVTYSWSPGGGTGSTINPTVSTTTIYTVTATDAAPAGCTATATVQITINSTNISTSATATTICNGASSTLSATQGSTTTQSWVETLVGGVTTPAQCATWDAFRASLVPAPYISCNMSGTFDPVGRTATTPATVQAIANALKNATTFSALDGGNTWQVGVGCGSGCGGGVVELSADGTTCSCTSPGYNVRPNLVGSNSGGVNTATCGGPTQTITVSFTSNSVGPLSSYSWAPATGLSCTSCATPVASPSVTTTYTVTGTLTNGCTGTATITVNVISVTTNCSGTNVSCFGGNNGSASVAASGGNGGPYTYLWSNANTNSSITGLSAGTYCVTVTDAGGCTGSCCYIVTEPTALVATAIATDASCPLCPDGTVSINSATGGTPAYTFTNLTGLLPGNYCITVTDANSCTTSACATVGAAGCTLNANASVTNNVSCFGGNNGSATSAPTGGVIGPIAYAWSTGSTNASVSGLIAGNYTVIVSDLGTGCVVQGVVTITQPTVVTANCSGTNVSCFGGSNGAASVIAGGGTPGYTYLWNDASSSTSSSISGLTAGIYCVTVTDANGCTATCCYTVTQPAAVTATGTNTNVVCAESPTGTITITPAGGTPGYTFLWSNGSTNQNLTGLMVGTYTVIITDANGCTGTYSGTVSCTDNIPPVIGTVGSIQVAITGNGSYADEITWTLKNTFGTTILSGGPYGFNPPLTLSAIVPDADGPYTFFIEAQGTFNDNSCLWEVRCNGNPISSGCIQGTSNGGSCLNVANLTVTNIIGCSQGCPSNIVTNNDPGVCGTTVSWTPPPVSDNCVVTLTSNHNPGDFFPVGTTVVTYTATDGCGNVTTCSFNVTVNQVGPPILNFSDTHVNADCQGTNSGSIDLTVTSIGGGPYSYLWSNSTTLEDPTGLFVGVYTVTVTDPNGCSASYSVSIGDFPPLQTTETHMPILCNGDLTGSIDITATDGKPGYDYLWNDGNINEDRTGLGAGTYTVTVSDQCGSSQILTITLTEPPALALAPVVTNVTCFGACNGSISTNVSGGTPGYTYLWSPASTDANLSALCPGTYIVTVTDLNNCTITASYTITEPPQLFISETHVNVSCNGGGNGSIDLTLVGGTPPFSFLWSNGATTEDLINRTASSYFVTVTEGNGCTHQTSVVITQPTALVLTLNPVNVTCAALGSITTSVSGGTPAYSYLWTGGATTSGISGLNVGTYSVIVTDANGCSVAKISNIILNNTLAAVLTVNANSSCGLPTGSATVTPSGGTAPYAISWFTIPVQTTATATGLPAGINKVLITDAFGCSKIFFVTIGTTNGLGVQLTSPTFIGGKNISCFGGFDGAATATPLYSPGPYTYIWSTGSTNATITGLSAGTYTVTVANAGCKATGQITLTQPNALIATATKVNPGCNGGCNGTATANATGGTAPYTYSWNSSPVQNTKTATGLCAGTYTCTVTDANGCVANVSITLVNASGINVTAVIVNLNCFGINTGKITQTVTGGTSPYTYLWNSGSTLKNRTGLAAGTYTVTVTDSRGCTAQATYTVTQPTLMVLTSTKTNVLCNGGNTGTATVSASGGTPAYTYSWNTVPVQTNATATGLTAGNKICTVKDANNCTKSITVTINQPSAISVSTTQTNVSTFGGNNGTATANPAGGVSPYSYSWTTSPVKTTQTVTGLTAGTYTVTVTDANGCTKTKTVTITQPGPRIAGADDIQIFDIKAYPNPGSGMVNLSFESVDASKYHVYLFDMLGKVVYTKNFTSNNGTNNQQFDFTAMPKGIYILKVELNNQQEIIRLVIQ